MDLCFGGLFSMLAALILWGACLLVFVASPNQKFTHKRPNKFASWSVFCILTSISCLLFAQVYPLVIAIILVLALVITMWLMIIFFHAHSRLTLLPFSITGMMAIGALVSLGGVHVV
jgi:hypothetical protein